MFEKKPAILYLMRYRLGLFSGSRPFTKLYEGDWDGIHLDEAFKKLRSFRIRSVKVLAGNDRSYLLALKVKTEELTRDAMIERAKTVIPEDVTSTNFDWRIVGDIPDTDLHIVQILCYPQEFLSSLSTASRKEDIRILMVDTVATLLAKKTATYKNPHILIWSGFEKLGLVAHHGIVFIVEHLESDIPSLVSSLKGYVQNEFNITPHVILADVSNEDRERISSHFGQNVIAQSFHPVEAFASSQKGKGEDKNVLEVKPVLSDASVGTSDHGGEKETKPIRNEPKKESEEKKKNHLGVFLGVFGVLVIILAVVVYMQYFRT